MHEGIERQCAGEKSTPGLERICKNGKLKLNENKKFNKILKLIKILDPI